MLTCKTMVNQTKEQILNLETVLASLKEQENIWEKFQIETLALFGSTALNQATENSDLDFLVEFKGELTFDMYMNLKFFLEDLFNKKVDLVIKQDLKPQIREKVINQAINVTQP